MRRSSPCHQEPRGESLVLRHCHAFRHGGVKARARGRRQGVGVRLRGVRVPDRRAAGDERRGAVWGAAPALASWKIECSQITAVLREKCWYLLSSEIHCVRTPPSAKRLIVVILKEPPLSTKITVVRQVLIAATVRPSLSAKSRRCLPRGQLSSAKKSTAAVR